MDAARPRRFVLEPERLGEYWPIAPGRAALRPMPRPELETGWALPGLPSLDLPWIDLSLSGWRAAGRFVLATLVALPLWLKGPVMLAAAAMALLLLVAFGRSLLAVGEVAIAASMAFIEQASEAFTRALLAIGEGTVRVFGAVLGAPFVLLRFIAELLHDLMLQALGPWLAQRREHRELRQVWRELYRDQYPTFRAFLRAVHAHDGQQEEDGRDFGREEAREEPPRADDGFAAACALLGLPADGRFTKADLEARYRAAIRLVHPDHVGANPLAERVNAARDLIKRQKGWK